MNNIVGHKEVIDNLKSIIKSGKISNAYLFCGVNGIGKFQVAKEFAKAILCSNPIEGVCCGECDSCKTFLSSSDIVTLESEEGVIKVDAIRSLCKEIMLKPTISNRRVFIINDADLMNDSSQNALLKSLEEPPKYATIILVASNKSMLKKTILSRCVTINFQPLSKDELKEVANQNNIVINDMALDYCNGSFGKLISLLNCNYLDYLEDLEKTIDIGNLVALNKSLTNIKKLKTIKEDIDDILCLLIKRLSQTIDANYNKRISQIGIIEEVRNNINRNANLEDSLDYMIIRLWEESKRRN